MSDGFEIISQAEVEEAVVATNSDVLVPNTTEVQESLPTKVTENVSPLNGNLDAETGNNESKKRKSLEPRSGFWVHFDKFECLKEKIQMAKCKYCSAEIKADPKKHGTNVIKNHFLSCKRKPEVLCSGQMRLYMQKTLFSDGNNKESRSSLWKYEELKARIALSVMVIVDELPFKTVEHEGFKHFVSTVCPVFTLPSRKTLSADVLQVYIEEKIKLKNFLKNCTQRVCITTDSWTSIQKLNYMSLTVHFIDNDWKLQKKIVNFCPITSHKGEDIGKAVEKCIREWGIDKIFTITVDNASSNDVAVAYLKKRMDVWRTSIRGNQYVHMRCIAHIINLVVQDGLKSKEEHNAINCIRGAVRYIRNSPARYQTFLKCIEMEGIESKKMLSLDVPTRWNSTYLMLEAAINLRSAFVSYEFQDDNFRKDLEKTPFTGVPSDYDWERAALLTKFLGSFYDLTLKVSGSSYVTSNSVFHEISVVECTLKEWLESDDFELREMAVRMKAKLDKYWGSVEKMNKVLYFAVVLDPCHKLEYLEYFFDKMYDTATSKKMKDGVSEGLTALFNEYKRMYGDVSSTLSLGLGESVTSSVAAKSPIADSGKKHRLQLKKELKRIRSGGAGEHVKSELERYLSEETEDEAEDDDHFDILKWWKDNAHMFPLLSKLARDVLAVPVSTVASEAAFSTGGRVLDPFRSSLLPKTVQVLICSQDWLSGSPLVSGEEDIYGVHALEHEYSKLAIGSGPMENTD